MLFGSGAEAVKHDSRLHSSDAALRIDLENLRHVLGEIQYHGYVAALARERRSASAAEQRRFEIATNGNRGENVIGIAGKYHADRNLAVVRAVGGVESAAAIVKANVSAYASAQSLRQS
jgi:hypothetical protein